MVHKPTPSFPFLQTSFSSPREPGSSRLGEPVAFPEGSSICSGWETLAAVLARLAAWDAQPTPASWPAARAQGCASTQSQLYRLKGDTPLESARENKNLWCIVSSNKDSPGSEAIIFRLALQKMDRSAVGKLFALVPKLTKSGSPMTPSQ